VSFLDIVIGTGIVWLLTALGTIPLARALTRRKTRTVTTPGTGESAVAEAEGEIDTGYYILADVLVLGVAGLVIGWIAGWFFIGITWHAKNWPGLIAFIAASVVGSILHG
jgi:hypothetical protein